MTTSDFEKELGAIIDRISRDVALDWQDVTEHIDSDQRLKDRVDHVLSFSNHKQRYFNELFGLGPLEDLIEDEAVTEIAVQGVNSVWFEKNGQWAKHPDHFLSPLTLRMFVDRLCSEARLKIDLNEPFASGRWRRFRVHIATAPLVEASHSVVLRRQAEVRWTMDRLEKSNWASGPELNLLRQLVRERKNILVIGPTGSGKTTVLSSLLAETQETERTLILEDTPEIVCPNSASLKMLTRTGTDGYLKTFDLSDLLKEALRMRPHRLVVGEVRGTEAKDLLLALSTGHTGCMGTLHASSAQQALLRLEMLVQMGAADWSLHTIRQLIRLSLDYIIVTEQAEGHRQLKGIHRIAGLESFGFLLESIHPNT